MDLSTSTLQAELQADRRASASKTCRQCGRSFSRNEHLHRHELIHTQETPFRCPHCHQRYQRADVLRRHVKRFCQRRSGVIQDNAPAPKKHRIKVACDLCHEKKLKCTGTFPCRTCEQQGRLCTAVRVANADRNGPNQYPSAAGAFPDVNSADSFPILHSSAIGTDIRPETISGRVHFQDGSGMEDGSFDYRDTGTRNLPQLMLGHSALGGSIHASTTGGFVDENDVALDGQTASALYPQPHPSISASFEPLFQAMDVMIQQEDATHLAPGTEQPTTTVGITPSRPPVNYDFMSLWDEGSYDDLWHSPSHFFDNVSPDYDPMFLMPGDVMDFESNQTATPIREIGSLVASPSAALKTLQDNRRFPSRPSSPRRFQEHPKWLLDPPSRRYDSEIVNVFLNLFAVHVTTSFTTFQDFRITENTPASLILAMAAVGGLFCKIDGSFPIARAMHNDARRIMLTRVFTASTYEHGEMIGVVQVYMLASLFGICSGDKRYYECAEALHKQLLETVFQFRLLDDGFSKSEEEEHARRRLINSLHLLECYRVVLLQRPPNLYPSTIRDSGSSNNIDPALSTNSEYATSEEDIMPSITLLMTPDSPLEPFSSNAKSTWCLAALSLYSWQSISSGPVDRGADILWKREFFELALNRWATAYGNLVEPRVMLLFHTNLIGLRTNIKHVHHVTQLYLRGELDLEDASHLALRKWCDDDDCEHALWHANEVIRAAEDLNSRRRSPDEEESRSAHAVQSFIEAPHIPFCIYLSTLTLWAATMVKEKPAIALAKAHLESGVQILGHLEVRIAQVLRRVLGRLINATDNLSQ